jgi:hypothetical protein
LLIQHHAAVWRALRANPARELCASGTLCKQAKRRIADVLLLACCRHAAHARSTHREARCA